MRSAELIPIQRSFSLATDGTCTRECTLQRAGIDFAKDREVVGSFSQRDCARAATGIRSTCLYLREIIEIKVPSGINNQAA